MILLGSHVGMSSPDMFLGSVKEALSYQANTFMLYTGAPQNTKRKALEELKIPEAHKLMKENNISQFIVHAPYIINLANSVNSDIQKLAIDFLTVEIQRTNAMGSNTLVLHPGSHVSTGAEIGIKTVIEGLNEVLEQTSGCDIALETMAGKGSEIGRNFEELASIIDGLKNNKRIKICFDTCHVNDAGYDIVNHFEDVMEQFDHYIGTDRIAVFHINDSMNPLGSAKDRHANIGRGTIGLNALKNIVHHPDFLGIPKILETPYIPSSENPEIKLAPYKEEIALLLDER